MDIPYRPGQHFKITPAPLSKSQPMTGAHVGRFAGLLGVAIVVGESALSAAVYRGRDGQTYSPLNHFVSELGHTHYSAWALLFNLGLVLGNLCLVPFTLAASRQMGGRMGALFLATGLLTNFSGAAVGLSPMTHLFPHLIVAFIFFAACLATIALFTAHALLLPSGSWGRWIALPGLLNLACFAVFFGECILLRHSLREIVRMLSHRPQVWLLPASEWCVFLTILLWIVFVACQFEPDAARAPSDPSS